MLVREQAFRATREHRLSRRGVSEMGKFDIKATIDEASPSIGSVENRADGLIDIQINGAVTVGGAERIRVQLAAAINQAKP